MKLRRRSALGATCLFIGATTSQLTDASRALSRERLQPAFVSFAAGHESCRTWFARVNTRFSKPMKYRDDD